MQYIERLVEKDLKAWKDNDSDYGLEVTGCRQVGKTTTVLTFAKQNYENVIYVNVSVDSNIDTLKSVDENTVLQQVQRYCITVGKRFTDTKDTVLIFDEIQESKELYERIRVFHRCLHCDLIVTGSNLAKAKEFFQPAGDLMQVRVYPLSYEEYLNYYGAYEYYKQSSIDQIVNEKYAWFKEVYDVYCQVGGYPAVFCAYLNDKPIKPVFESLLETFKSEFRINTGNPADYDKIEVMFETICRMMCREKKGDARLIETASKITAQNKSKRVATEECNNLLSWLSAARLVNYCDKLDLRSGERYSSERLYFEDIGLFNYLCDKYCIDKSTVAGMSAETFAFKQLKENDYFNRFYGDRPAFAIDGSCELDFCVDSRLDGKRYGIEVKAGKNTGTSMNKMLQNDQIDFAVYAREVGKDGAVGKVYTLPLFLLNKFSFDKGTPLQSEPLKRISVFHA